MGNHIHLKVSLVSNLAYNLHDCTISCSGDSDPYKVTGTPDFREAYNDCAIYVKLVTYNNPKNEGKFNGVFKKGSLEIPFSFQTSNLTNSYQKISANFNLPVGDGLFEIS